MKRILTRRTPLIRGLHRRRNDRVANCALGVAFESTLDVATESHQTVDQVARKHDNTLDRK